MGGACGGSQWCNEQVRESEMVLGGAGGCGLKE